MGYLRRISNYLKRITLYDPTHRTSIIDLLAISVETPVIDSVCSLTKVFSELIYMNP